MVDLGGVGGAGGARGEAKGWFSIVFNKCSRVVWFGSSTLCPEGGCRFKCAPPSPPTPFFVSALRQKVCKLSKLPAVKFCYLCAWMVVRYLFNAVLIYLVQRELPGEDAFSISTFQCFLRAISFCSAESWFEDPARVRIEFISHRS